MKQQITTPNERKIARKEVRKAASHVGFGILMYTGIMAIVLFVAGIFLATDIPQTASMQEAITLLMNHPVVGILQAVAPLVALPFVFLCFAKRGTHKQLFTKSKPMTLKTFGALLCVMYLFDFVGTCIYQLVELDLNVFGHSTALGLEMATGYQTNLPMFLAIGFVAPIVEELVCRGFLLRRMEKHGKVLAIVLSSVMFGMMHENLPQIITATLTGMVLGYITLEYSIVWSILLHAFNNLVLCDLLSRLLKNSGEIVQFLVYRSVYLVASVVALVVLFRNRKSVLSWIRNNLSKKSVVFWAFTSVGVLAALAIFSFGTINTIKVMA